MNRILSDEDLRRALMHLVFCPDTDKMDDERAQCESPLARSAAWMSDACARQRHEVQVTGWILDCDSTIKLLYSQPYRRGASSGVAVIVLLPKMPTMQE